MKKPDPLTVGCQDKTPKSSGGREMPPQRGVRPTRSRSGDLEVLKSHANSMQKQRIVRSSSADSRLGVSLSLDIAQDLISRFGSDDLEEIFKHAAKGAEPSENSTLNSKSLSHSLGSSSGSIASSTYLYKNSIDGRDVEAVLDSLFSDTEETYGIDIPQGVIDALKKSVKKSAVDPTLLRVVRALHDDDVMDQAETYYQGSIPIDLIQAIRASSLPPGTNIPAFRYVLVIIFFLVADTFSLRFNRIICRVTNGSSKTWSYSNSLPT
jgi:hypothetical protein